MRAPELGEKRACAACAARFYDLRRKPAVCPICQAVQPPERPRAARGAVVSRAVWSSAGSKPAKVEIATADADVDAEPDEDDADEGKDEDDADEGTDKEVLPARVVE